MQSLKKYLLVLCLSCTAQAQEAPNPSKTPKAALEKVQAMVGDWIISSKSYNPKTEGFQEYARAQVKVKPVLKGLGLKEVSVRSISGKGFELETTLSYDQYRKHYRLMVLDDTWGIMDIYEGTLDEGQLVMTNLGKNTGFPLPDGRVMEFQLTYELNAEARSLVINSTTDHGETWSPMYKIDYTRP